VESTFKRVPLCDAHLAFDPASALGKIERSPLAFHIPTEEGAAKLCCKPRLDPALIRLSL
jgi:hypothetical protein